MSAGKYRLRTALPEGLTLLAPKGHRDCGNHEWYTAEPGIWRCYHCTVGLTREIPWDERETAARGLEADAMRIRAGLDVQERLPLAYH